MKHTVFLLLAAGLFLCFPVRAEAARNAPQGHGDARPAHAMGIVELVQPVVFYIPNRVFDLLDILRLRLRVGPGFSVGARATQVANVFVGGHSTLFAGLRGARGKRGGIPWPFGTEIHGGVEVSVADVTNRGLFAPVVDPLELGVEGQAGLVGVYGGLELYEVLDFATGFLFVDLSGDDF